MTAPIEPVPTRLELRDGPIVLVLEPAWDTGWRITLNGSSFGALDQAKVLLVRNRFGTRQHRDMQAAVDAGRMLVMELAKLSRRQGEIDEALQAVVALYATNSSPRVEDGTR